MAGYIWAPDSQHLLFDADGHLWIYHLANGTGSQIGYTGAGSGNDPKFSPDGKSISFLPTTASPWSGFAKQVRQRSS